MHFISFGLPGLVTTITLAAAPWWVGPVRTVVVGAGRMWIHFDVLC